MDTPSNIFEQLWLYNRWANGMVLSVFEKYGSQLPASSLRLMSHVLNAQLVWVSRIKGQIPSVGIWDEHDLDTCKKMNDLTFAALKEVIDGQPDYTGIRVSYKTSNGMAFESTWQEILLQVFTHAPYHRGQIARDLREKGLEPVNTDFIMYTRMK